MDRIFALGPAPFRYSALPGGARLLRGRCFTSAHSRRELLHDATEALMGEPEHVTRFVLRCAEAFDLKGVWGFC